MFVRKSMAAAFAATISGAIVAVTAGSAAAAYAPQPDDSLTSGVVAADLIGGGSDTSQTVMKSLADAWNAKGTAPRIATYAATGGGDIPLPDGTLIPRPNGSGAGKNLLHGATNVPQVDFARSSSGPSTTETADGLKNFPFALDTLMMATAPVSNAPASLTPAQIVGIYKGDITNWSQVGGQNGVIQPMIPQSGSGTRSFFTGELQKMNGGTAVTLAGHVTNVQEHEDDPIKDNPNAIAPFSQGRAGLVGTLRLEQGWSADRAIFNVFRGAEVNDSIRAIFGPDGFICSDEAKPLIEAAGFKQLARPAFGGVCGEALDTNTSNFLTNTPVATTTTLKGATPAANTVRLDAAVSVSEGTVSFYEGTTVVRANVPVSQGGAVATLTGVSAGAHTYVAKFTPAANSLAVASESAPVTVTVTATSTSPSQACLAAKNADSNAVAALTAAKSKVAKAKKAYKLAVGAKKVKAKKKLAKAKKSLKNATAAAATAKANATKACA